MRFEPERSNIMNTEQNQVPQDTEKLKEIPKWTRRYAQNRTLTILVLMVMVCLISMVIAVSPVILFVAFHKRNTPLALVGIVVLIAVLIFYVILLLKFGGKNRGLIDRRIDKWIYGNEGTASISKPELTKKKKWLEYAVAMVWLSLFIGTMYLGMENFIPVKYVQPVTALYYVPFMVFSWYFWRSPMMGPIFLLSPILYAIHAILIVAGVPIFFRGQFGVILNMSLPLIVYGFLTPIIGHIYGRYALKKLKDITHLEGDAANGV
jgi:drug/metabolite transporter (DMT)-like permease